MKTLVLYASKYGMTKKIANIVVRHRTNVHLFNIKKFTGSLNDYDEIILGTPVYAGTINKDIKKILNSYKSELLSKKLSVFLVGMNPDNENEVIKMNFDEEIINHANIKYTGGAFQFEKMNFLFKMIVKKIAKTDQSQEMILHDNIDFLLH